MTTSPAAGKCCDVALHVDLRLLAVRRRRQGDDPEDARAHPLGERADRAAFAGAVAALEDDDDPQALLLDPVLQMAQLDLQLPQLLLLCLSEVVLLADVVGPVTSSARAELPDFRNVVEAARAGDKVELHVRRLAH